MKSKLIATAASILFLSSGAAFAGDAAKGEGLYNSKGCVGCHGMNGKSNNEAMYPTIAGKGAGFVSAAIADFKAGKRSNPMMGPMANTVTDAEAADIDAYLAGK
ncbi:MAG: c-type cytochrome [Gammaproteobacteria bacterium]